MKSIIEKPQNSIRTKTILLLALLICCFYLSCNISGDTVLSPGAASAPYKIQISEENEVTLQLVLSTDTDWSQKGNESAVLTILVDGRKNQDVVIYSGKKRSGYHCLLGRLKPGNHQVRFLFNRELSAAGATTITLGKVTFKMIPPEDPRFEVIRYTPVLYGRNDNASTDTPLLMYYEQKNVKNRRTLEYSVIWSNEDGGTNSVDLMSRWGRTTDIELIYRRVTDDKDRVIREEFHGEDHDTLRFAGQRIDDHPVLRTATLNNTVSDSGISNLKFFLYPVEKKFPESSRESMMDANPLLYKIMYQEMVREKKYENPADPFTPEVSDARNYLYIEFLGRVSGEDPRLTFAVRLKKRSTWFYSDHANGKVDAVNKSGWRRSTIELPENTRPADLDKLLVKGAAKDEFAIQLMKISKIFFLSKDFHLLRVPFPWDRPVELSKTVPVATWAFPN